MPSDHPLNVCLCGNYPSGPCREDDCDFTPEDSQTSADYWAIQEGKRIDDGYTE